jgi:hypothetical protein
MIEFKVGDKVVQIQGPCREKTFRVVEVDGNLIRVTPDPKLPGISSAPEWTHKGNYIPKR